MKTYIMVNFGTVTSLQADAENRFRELPLINQEYLKYKIKIKG